METLFLNGLTPQKFLQEYWQKKPLLVRQAIPDIQTRFDLPTPQQVCELACDEDIESRLIWQQASEWQLMHGPLSKRDFPARKVPWTVLVQGLNLVNDPADDLLREFNFIPYSRLDDVMVSYATPGGGVGPHFDSYDVFLLQGYGARSWQISAQKDLRLVPDAPLKILQKFKPSQEWVLQPGDMLYLPPHYAHNGVAVNECMTYSIGFRAPSQQELVSEFLFHLQDKFAEDKRFEKRYTDPDLRFSKHSAQIGSAMIGQVETMMESIQWTRADISEFLGRYLTEPKPTVFFDPPEAPLSFTAFRKKALRFGVKLDRKTQMLYNTRALFLNGDRVDISAVDMAHFRALADQRVVKRNLSAFSPSAWENLYAWYCAGYVCMFFANQSP